MTIYQDIKSRRDWMYLQIRNDRKKGMTFRQLSEKYGLGKSQCCNICKEVSNANGAVRDRK